MGRLHQCFAPEPEPVPENKTLKGLVSRNGVSNETIGEKFWP
jgi:hypothetical protein